MFHHWSYCLKSTSLHQGSWVPSFLPETCLLHRQIFKLGCCHLDLRLSMLLALWFGYTDITHLSDQSTCSSWLQAMLSSICLFPPQFLFFPVLLPILWGQLWSRHHPLIPYAPYIPCHFMYHRYVKPSYVLFILTSLNIIPSSSIQVECAIFLNALFLCSCKLYIFKE